MNALLAELAAKADKAKEDEGKCMCRNTANLKGPDPEAVDLGPDNIFAQMGESDAEERLLKTTLVSKLRAVIADRKLTQIKAGEILGVPQPKVWELVRRSLRLQRGASDPSPEQGRRVGIPGISRRA